MPRQFNLRFTAEFLVEELKTKTIRQIAEENSTYPNLIIRHLKRYGIAVPSKSDAQKLALKSNRATDPTEGKKHSTETREKMSDNIHKAWTKLGLKEKERRREKSREVWNRKSESEKREMLQKAGQAIRRVSEEGSATEKFLCQYLSKEGFQFEFHKKNMVGNEKLEVDFYVPSALAIIEIDGPAHFSAEIFGEKDYLRHTRSDNEKNGLLIAANFNVIRVKHLNENPSDYYHRNMAGKIIEVLRQI
ncbi:MAG: DUF559 domain-containing protein, partial [Nanoarchaeota archaeon]